MRDSLRVSFLGACLLMAACRPNADDDRFARAFITRLAARDSAAFSQVQPGSEVSRRGWAPIAAMAEVLPPGELRSLHLIEEEHGVDSQGAYRRLIYEFARVGGTAHVELWLVDHDGQTYINTVRIRRLPSSGADSSNVSMRLYN